MGKPGDAQSLPSTALDAQGTSPTAVRSNRCCGGVRDFVTLKCVLVLVLAFAVLLSAVFWLPLFHFGDRGDLDLEYAGHDIVASFMLKKPSSFLKSYILQLEDSILDEMSFSSTKVEILSLESLEGSNATKVVFAVESDLTTKSLIRASFVSIIVHETSLSFADSVFGNPFSFDVLKFRGGITATPYQKAFLWQSVQILFNFTLNFSVDEILDNFDELTQQLKTGLRFAPYENLYIRLTNLKGSTVDPPTTVRAQVLLAVGINPSRSRLKQLAQTIAGSHDKNLGLNNTVFGRVKQVSLSAILQHSLGNDGSNPSPSPSPTPSLSPLSKPYHRQHQKHHQRSANPPGTGLPISTPAPAPAQGMNKAAQPPACRFGYSFGFPWKHKERHPMAPSAPPARAPQPKHEAHSTPETSPVAADGPLPYVGHAHQQPPSHTIYHARPPNVMPSIPPSMTPSSAGVSTNCIWPLSLFILLSYVLIETEN